MTPKIKIIVKIKLHLYQNLRNQCDVATGFYGSDHALVICDLTQIVAEGSGCSWGLSVVLIHGGGQPVV